MLDTSKSNDSFILAKQNSRPLILDGAMGSYLQQKGFRTDNVIWTTNINRSNPDVIVQIYEDYIDAGADIITTNTFRTNPSAMLKVGINDCANYVQEAVNLAKQSINREQIILIAGSNPPAEDCYQSKRIISNKELELNHKYHIDLLIDNGVDFILNETQSHFDEIKIMTDYCDQKNIPYLVSLYFDSSLKILSGESLETVFSFLSDHNPLAVGINCVASKTFYSLLNTTKLPEIWGFYLNCGKGNPTDKQIVYGIEPDEYIETIKTSLKYKPTFIGSCCYSNPEHTRKIKEFLDG
jgi:homocysteine S-methyltransferase